MATPLVFDLVCKSFGDRLVYDGISFAAESGRCTVIEGPAGSGKSLLLRMAMQRVAPDSGVIRWFGQAVPPLTATHRTRIGCTGPGFQLDRLATVAEAILGEGAFRGLHGPALRSRFHALLETCNLKSAEDSIVRSLGAADQAVLQVAGAAIGDPEVIILDEPAANVPHAIDRIVPILHDAMDRGCAVVLLTKDGAPWRSLQPVRLVLQHGRIDPATATTAVARRAA